MATIQKSIEVNVSAETAYDRLTRFEEYPRFMEDVEKVRQIDETHLHWTTKSANRSTEWDAEITEREPGRCIVWHSTSGAANTGKVELQAIDSGTSRVTFTLQSQPEQTPGSMAGYTEEDMAQRLQQDMARMKDFVEGRESENAGESGQAGTPAATQQAGQQQSDKDANRTSPPNGVGTSAVVGASGGTDAAAGAHLSGNKNGPSGPSLRESTDAAGVPGAPGGMVQGDAVSPAAGAGAAGRTGLGETAPADDTRTGTGDSSGSGTPLGGNPRSGALDSGAASGKGKSPKR